MPKENGCRCGGAPPGSAGILPALGPQASCLLVPLPPPMLPTAEAGKMPALPGGPSQAALPVAFSAYAPGGLIPLTLVLIERNLSLDVINSVEKSGPPNTTFEAYGTVIVPTSFPSGE